MAVSGQPKNPPCAQSQTQAGENIGITDTHVLFVELKS
jgi:hypothetical protein